MDSVCVRFSFTRNTLSVYLIYFCKKYFLEIDSCIGFVRGYNNTSDVIKYGKCTPYFVSQVHDHFAFYVTLLKKC